MFRNISVLGIGLIVLLSAVGAVACGDDDGGKTADGGDATPGGRPEISVTEVWARNSPAGMMAGGAATPGMGTTPAAGMGTGTTVTGDRGAAYMIITNAGTVDDALIAASSSVSTATEVHESVMNGDQVTMREVDKIAVPAGKAVELKPGGYHVMFIGLKKPLTVGETVEVELTFEKAGKVTVTAEVRAS